MSRFWRITFKTIAGILAILVIGGAVLVWRLSTSPITTAYLTPYIERTVSHYIPDTHTEIDQTLLTWDNIEHTVSLHAEGLRVYDSNNDVIADVPKFDIQLSVFGLALGQILPLGLTVDQPHFKVERDIDGIIRFGGMSSNGKPHTGSGKNIKDTIAHVADNLAHALMTHRLEIMGTEFDVIDQSDNSTWAVHIPEISLERVDGRLTGRLAINLTQQDKVSTAEVHYNYDSEKSLHNLDTTLTDITPSFFAGGHPKTVGLGAASIFDLPISGNLSISFDSDLNVDVASVDMSGHDGRIVYGDFWDQPRDVKELKLKGEYDRHQGLSISDAHIDFGGPALNLMATGSPATIPTHDLDFEMNVKLDNWPMDQYGALWPKPVIPNAREWIAANMSKGMFTHGEATFTGELSWKHPEDIALKEGNGTIKAVNGQLHYMDDMPLLQGVNATATFDLNQMTVQIESGGANGLKIVPFKLQMTDFEKSVQYIDIPLQFTGTIPDIMKFIDAPKLQYAQAVGLKPDDINGTARGTLELHFPLLNNLLMKDVDIKGEMGLISVASSKLVKGIDITQGDLDLTIDKTNFAVKGRAVLNKISSEIEWQQYFNETEGKPLKTANVKGFITDDQWIPLGVNALGGTRGAVPVTIDLSEPVKDRTIITGKMDFSTAEVHVDQLNWKKPVNTPAILKFTADLNDDKDIQITSIDLQGAQIKVAGNAALGHDGHLKSLKLDPFMLGRTNAALSFSESADEDHALHYDVKGASLDVSGIKGDREPKHADPREKEYSVKLDKLYTSDTGFISGAEGHAIRDDKGWLEIGLQGMADGDHKLNVDLAKKNDKRFLSITCDDFGKALKGMGFTDTVNGGNLDIRGQSIADNDRIIEGHVKIGSFTVKNLPALALLLNATSPFGFSGLLTDSADFNSLKGDFRWEGDTIELKEVRVAGSSVGMNIDGKANMDSGDANLYGTLVPFSMVNRVLGAIPIIGDIITGGDGGGVLAVSYTIKGQLSKPDVGVNPVSLLTPGFLRNLFFSGDSDDSSGGTADQPKATQPLPPAVTNINKTR